MRWFTGFLALTFAALALPAMAQSTADRPLDEPQSYVRDSGVVANPSPAARTLHAERVAVAGAGWVRVYFGEVTLGPGSFLRITSERDGEVQELDAAALARWSRSTAYFNGDAVQVELIAGPRTNQNRLVIDSVASEAAPSFPTGGDCGFCGVDERQPSDEPWAARLLPAGCSASIYNTDSCAVSAGHCVGSNMVLEFHVPPSNANCSLNHPPVADQFPVGQFLFTNGGIGNDWMAMTMGTNNLGEKPFERYGELRPIATTPPVVGNPLEAWGYGVDDVCTQNQVQQTSAGQVVSVSPLSFNHTVDVTFGNSGGGVLRNGTEILGVVTHCPCPTHATRVDHPSFAAARQQLCPGGGQLVPAQLTAFNIVFGTTSGGGLAELDLSDDAYASVEAVTAGTRNNTVTEVIAQAPFSVVSELNLEAEVGAANVSPVFLIIGLFNFDSGMWDNLSFSVVSTSGDTLKVFDTVADPNAYVDPSGQIRVRVAETARLAQTPQGYTLLIDRVGVTVRP